MLICLYISELKLKGSQLEIFVDLYLSLFQDENTPEKRVDKIFAQMDTVSINY